MQRWVGGCGDNQDLALTCMFACSNCSFDVVTVFGQQIMQASTIQSTEHREWFHLIGRNHDIQHWRTEDPRVCIQVFDREYSPGELEDSEDWIAQILEPVRTTYMQPPAIKFVQQLFLPEEPLPAEATVALLVGTHPKAGGTWKEVLVYKSLGVVEVYEVMSHGRRWYRSLQYTSNAKFCLRELQPSIDDRKGMWPSWERHGAGSVYAEYDDKISETITRSWDALGNLSGGTETYLPARLMYGLIPSALLDTHLFW